MKSGPTLDDMLDQSLTIRMWVNTVLDFTQLLLVIVTIIYLCSRKERISNLSWVIRLQVALFFAQAIGYNTRNFWQIRHDYYQIDRAVMPDYIFIAYLIADFCFWTQHWLYVSEYARVSLLIPLIFSLQTEQVQKRRRCYHVFCRLMDLAMYTFFVARTIIFVIKQTIVISQIDIISVVTMIILTLTLGMALSRLRRINNDLSTEGIFSNETLILVHMICFILAALFMFVTTGLEQAKLSVDSTSTQDRLSIAFSYI